MIQNLSNSFLSDDSLSKFLRFNLWFKALAVILPQNMDAWFQNTRLIGIDIPQNFNDSIHQAVTEGALSKEQASHLERAMLTNRFNETTHANKRKAL
jgi:hypothetical protein